MEDTPMEENGAIPRTNKFGPEPHQVMPGEWADMILAQLAEQNPALFGRLLLAASLSRNGKPFEVTRPGRPPQG
jgi:hypothetical protein